MPEIVRVLAISTSVLLAVVVLIVVISSVVVRRGEAEMAEDARQHGHGSH
ncbi:MAG: hypothetical protein HY646_03380 [Acidobacteria bacterium]|nr:hypothetical protein [Acidobacteriota bacterium]